MNHFETLMHIMEQDGSRSDSVVDYFKVHYKEIYVEAKAWKPPREEKIFKYLITFTIDPKKPYKSTNEIETYIVKLLSKLPCLEECYYVKEHPLSNVHWHAIVKLKGQAIKYNKFDYYKRHIGIVDISKSRITNSDEFSSKYLQKEAQPIKIK